MAIGRKPNVQGLCGPDVSLEMKNGKIAVSPGFETSEPGVYAIGDVCADIQLAHVAAAQVHMCGKNCRRPHTIRLQSVPSGMYVSLPIVPNCIYTDPRLLPLALRRRKRACGGLRCDVVIFPWRKMDVPLSQGEQDGFIRLVFEAYSNTIVGAQMMCPRATDMIGEIATAIANGLTAEQMSFAMRAQPTYNEGIGAAIEDALRKA